MSTSGRIPRRFAFMLAAASLVLACPFDSTLREYLSAHFWLPFAKRGANFERPNVRRISAPFAGMGAADGGALGKLRSAYQHDPAALEQAVAAARADRSLTRREREEVDLIDAKIDLRPDDGDEPARLEAARKKLEAFLRTAKTTEFLSEARGWLGRVHYLLGNQTAAGKIYLDELNRDGSNLSRETLLNSLRMTYGYDGGAALVEHLEEYFDTPQHATFAIQLATNPHFHRNLPRFERDDKGKSYARIRDLLEEHSGLLRAESGDHALPLLAMRTALRMGDPAGARKMASAVPENAAVRSEPDFLWMLAAADFLSRDYRQAERPLLSLFRSERASQDQKAAAAYALCGVYRKAGNALEQLRYALWLHSTQREGEGYVGYPSEIADMSVYWAVSGWDLNLLLEDEAPIDTLRTFMEQNPNLAGIRIVKYSLAVRLARENRYEESAAMYDAIHAVRRAPRMRRLAALYEAKRTLESRYALAEFIAGNENRLYFNDALWGGLQRYALQASTDYRLTRAEREQLIAAERRLKDDQEEYWRAYLILKDVVREAGRNEPGRRAAVLGIRCLRGISERFGREEEIRRADIELSRWLRQ